MLRKESSLSGNNRCFQPTVDMIRDEKTVTSGCGNVQCSVVQHSIAQRCLINICGRKKRREYRKLPNIVPAEFISLSGRYMGADR